jgi:hypothetical protein
MAVSAENTRHTVTLPTALVERLKREQGPGQTLSDVLRLRLEQAYTGMDAHMAGLTQRVEQLVEEVAVVRAALEQLVGLFETFAKAPALGREPQPIPEAPPMVTYEQLYGEAPVEAESPPLPVVTQERKRWWHR